MEEKERNEGSKTKGKTLALVLEVIYARVLRGVIEVV